MERRALHIPLAASLALLVAACDTTGPGAEAPLVQAAAPEFALEINGNILEAAIVTTFTNRTRQSIYFDYCPPLAMALEVRRPTETTWVRGFDPIIACPGYNDTRKLRPGSARTDTLHVFGCLDGSCHPTVELVPDAEYRVVYAAATDADLGELLAIEDRASNPFRLVVAGPEPSVGIAGGGP